MHAYTIQKHKNVINVYPNIMDGIYRIKRLIRHPNCYTGLNDNVDGDKYAWIGKCGEYRRIFCDYCDALENYLGTQW